MDKKQREARRQQEDIALQRGLLWVVGAVVLEALLVLLNRFYFHADLETEVNIYLGLHEVLRVMRMASPVAVVLALVWTAWQLKQGKKFGLPLIVTIALAAVAVCVHVTLKYGTNGMSMLYWLVIAWAVLALVFYIYQREFFLGASACGMSVLGLWFIRYGAAARWESAMVLAAIALVASGLGESLDLIIIGAFMGLVPGVALTNFMRDVLAGDLFAGITKLTESLLTATALALGAGIALSLARYLGGGV